MGICPKCKCTFDSDALFCDLCEALLSSQSEEASTLVFSDQITLAEELAKSESAPGVQETLDSLPITDISDSSKPNTQESQLTVDDSSDFEKAEGLIENPQTLDIPISAPRTIANDDESATLDLVPQDTAESATLDLPPHERTDHDFHRDQTIKMTEHEARSGNQGQSNPMNSGISTGHLKRVWDAAIAYSDAESQQSLRYDRAEASDSVFRRVALREVADINSNASAGADYQIKEKLGEGGMGIVYSAVQTTVNRIVAVKSIRKDKSVSEKSRNQFFYEAEITADLDHPNIPPIYDLGTTKEGSLFYSMKLIDGIEWRKVISVKTREENLEVFKKVSDAVAFAHSKNVIHRDLKPENVMLGKYGEVYVTDWGLASNMNLKKPMDFGGTPDYMAPEMARNRQSKIGKASDVYLLGAILFQMVTGSPPHVGRKVLDRLAAAERNEIVPANTEDTLLDIAYKAMATEPSERYLSVEEMQEAIRQIRLHEESIMLSHRAEEAAGLAVMNKDYDRFTRAIFGFRDAIELWDDNQAAIQGLQNARLAYAQCAFDKGDNDLVLQTLNRDVEVEATLYNQAANAKAAIIQREQRFKTLRKTFAIAVLAFLGITTGLAGFATLKWRGEGKATKKALASANEEKLAKIAAEKSAEEEKIAKQLALRSQEAAELSAEQERKAKELAVIAKQAAETSAEEERKAKVLAVSAQQAAEVAAEGERVAKISAQNRAAQIQLGDYQTKLGLAKLQIEQFDNRGASQLLNELKGISANEFGRQVPRFDSWGSRRISMLTNADLPRQQLVGKVTSMDFALAKNVGIAGTEDGKVYLLRFQNEALSIDVSIDYPGASVESVAISPNGDEAVFSIAEKDRSQVFVWSIQPSSKPRKLESTQNRAFQAFAYSPNGDRLIGGINGGIWIWSRNPNWIEKTSPLEVPKVQNVRGRLTRLQWTAKDTVLATSVLNGKPILYQLELQGTDNTSRLVELPSEIDEKLTAVLQLPGNRMLFGLTDGSMLTGDLNLTNVPAGKASESSFSKLVALPRKHQTAITHFTSNPNGTILSLSDEPVAHVWLADSSGTVTYDSYLTGTPSLTNATNLSQASFVSDGIIVSVDGAGTAVVWDILRQKQRRRLSRLASNQSEEYSSPVVGVFNRGQSQQALSITDDGAVDLWDFQTGKTIPINERRWSYFGHTPGAQFVDSVVDMEAGLIVTSANLKNAERRYLDDASYNWEFCVWDQKSGNMLQRWTENSDESVERRLSILESGKQLLISSDNSTRIVDFSGKSILEKENLGTYFAIPNPKDPSLTAMIKRSGYTWLWNRSNSSASLESRPRLFVSDDKGEDGFPLKGIWSPTGDRFYVVYSNGSVYRYEKNDYQPNKGWPRKKLWQAQGGTQYRAKYHYDLDLAIAMENDQSESLYVGVRTPGSHPETNLTVLRLDLITKKATLVESASKSKAGTYWLDASQGELPHLSDQIHQQFKLREQNRDSVLSKIHVGQHTFVSTRSGKVYDLTDNSANWVSLGRNRLLSATADKEGRILWTLHNDGSLWKLELNQENHGEWKRADWTAQDCESIHVSPDGLRLAMLSKQNGLKIVETTNGKIIGEFPDVALIAWDGTDALIGYNDGKLERVRPDGRVQIARIEVASGSRMKSFNLFNESWSDPNLAPNRYLLIQTESDTEGLLHFVPLTPMKLVDKLPKTHPIGKGARIATSPTDPIFVTGNDAGTVSIWFASPKWDKVGVLFDLDGHRGAIIETSTFSNDGYTLITTDSNNRLYGWLSRDFAE